MTAPYLLEVTKYTWYGPRDLQSWRGRVPRLPQGIVEPMVSKLEFWSRLRSGSQNFGLDFDLSLKSLVTVLFSVSDVQS